MRREILGWLDHFDRELAKTRADIVSGASKKKMDDYRKELEAKEQRAQAVLRSLKRT